MKFKNSYEWPQKSENKTTILVICLQCVKQIIIELTHIYLFSLLRLLKYNKNNTIDNIGHLNLIINNSNNSNYHYLFLIQYLQ